MNKLMLFFSNSVVTIGICTLILTKITNLVLPKLGYAVFQSTVEGTGNYHPDNYIVNFTSVNLAAIVLIIGGLGLGHIVYRKEQGESLFKMPYEWFKS